MVLAQHARSSTRAAARLAVLALACAVALCALGATRASATPVYDQNLIISDANMRASYSMSADEIQATHPACRQLRQCSSVCHRSLSRPRMEMEPASAGVRCAACATLSLGSPLITNTWVSGGTSMASLRARSAT